MIAIKGKAKKKLVKEAKEMAPEKPKLEKLPTKAQIKKKIAEAPTAVVVRKPAPKKCETGKMNEDGINVTMIAASGHAWMADFNQLAPEKKDKGESSARASAVTAATTQNADGSDCEESSDSLS